MMGLAHWIVEDAPNPDPSMQVDEIAAFDRPVVRQANLGKNVLEDAVLHVLVHYLKRRGDTGCYLHLWLIAEEVGVSQDYVRAACRSLTDQGLATYGSGLQTEDGEFAGSGYSATDLGLRKMDPQRRQPCSKS